MVANLLVIVSVFYRTFRRIHDIERNDSPSSIATKATTSQVTEDQDFARETSIGRVSMLDTDDRSLSFSLTRFSELVWSSMRISEPPSLLTQNLSSRRS